MTDTVSLDPAAQRFLASTVLLHVDGRDVAAKDGATFTSVDPSNGQVLATVTEAGSGDVDDAVASARRALEDPTWRDLSPRDRAALLFRLAELLEENAEELAQLESLDSGKPLANARKTDIPQSADHIRYFAGWATKIEGATIPTSQGNHFVYTRREPVGVCALIVPWNYPLLMASWKVAPALACGNTIILKPAEQTPLTAARFGQLATEAGFPPGVFNVLQGRGEVTGKALVAHPGIDKVAFTGSTAVGKEIMAVAAKSLTRVSLELGGKSPNLIFADADLDTAIGGAGWGIFYNMGEDCCAGSRIFVERPIYNAVVEGLAKMAAAIPVGPGFNLTSKIGPLISYEQRLRVDGYVRGSVEDGGTIVTGGREPGGDLASGYYYEPTVITGVSNATRISQEEVFGPVVVVIPFDTEAEAVALANDTPYGLASGVWTNGLSRAHRVAAGIHAGMVYVNDYGPSDAAAPFGGFGASGFGREHGRAAIDLYTEEKAVWVNLG
jgi:acyl-CoA reductase-like NAD-dependent aldehyde dehydrogenase